MMGSKYYCTHQPNATSPVNRQNNILRVSKYRPPQCLSPEHESQVLTFMIGDRVQWFGAEAEMQRWPEQAEQKLAELLRTNRSFQTMERTWATLASANTLPGHQAYARQKAAMCKRRVERVQGLTVAADYQELLLENASIINRVQLERQREVKVVADAV
ncbi:hypothetical protein B0H14DRAFT_2594896 [Mycena olivaceomarginata]|nr:hypothetical protein B0H14DRAFT_2594896 [Mycena olivaceomarginata]